MKGVKMAIVHIKSDQFEIDTEIENKKVLNFIKESILNSTEVEYISVNNKLICKPITTITEAKKGICQLGIREEYKRDTEGKVYPVKLAGLYTEMTWLKKKSIRNINKIKSEIQNAL